MKILVPHYSLITPDQWPFKWFQPEELASKGDGSLLIDYDAIAMLDATREHLGKPMNINSAYRDPIHNARVGGAPRSMHKTGGAFDPSLRGHNKWELFEAAKYAGFTGFGFYNSFLHIDNGRRRSWGKWS